MDTDSSERGDATHRGKKRSPSPMFVDQNEGPAKKNFRGGNDSRCPKTDGQEILDMVAKLDMDKSCKVAGYDLSSEKRPALAPYHPNFAITEKQIAQVVKNVEAAVERAKAKGLRSDEIETICKSIKDEFADPTQHYPAAKHIALLGPPGIGKSSTSNSLLNQNTAIEVQDKQRGTNVVHEYSALRSKGRAAKYQVIARYLSPVQITGLVKRHCDTIFQSIEEEDNQDSDEGIAELLLEQRSTSLELLGVLLCDRRDFVDDDSIIDYFRSNEKNREDVCAYIEQGINKLKLTRSLDEYEAEHHIADDTSELHKVFRSVSRAPVSGSRRPHVWPIVEKVIICLDNDLLNAGVVLGDAPGTGDRNHAVNEIANNYIRNAGTVVVFDTPTRENKGSDLTDNLKLLAGFNKLDSICLVVTNIDKLANLSDELRDDLDPEDDALIRRAESAIAALDEQYRNATEQKDILMDAEEPTADILSEIKRIDKELAKLAIASAHAECHKKEVIIKIQCDRRGADYRQKLQSIAKSKHVPTLEIHFISNQEYAKHRAGYDAKNPPILSIEGTGIPALRRRLYHVPVKGRAFALEFVHGRKLPDALMSIKGVLTKSRMERRGEVEQALFSQLKDFDGVIKLIKHDLDRSFTEHVIQVIDEHAKDWAAAANELVSQWEEYKSGTFAAFCRKGGVWRLPRTKKMIHWNELLQKVITKTDALEKGFDEFETGITTAIGMGVENAKIAFNCLASSLDDHPAFKGVTGKDVFIKAICATRDSTLRAISALVPDITHELNYIRASTLHDADNSWLAESMHDTYKQCAIMSLSTIQSQTEQTKARKTATMKRKGGPHAERVKAVREKVTGSSGVRGLFMDIKVSARREFEEKMKEWVEGRVQGLIEESRKDLRTDFDRRFEAVGEEAKVEDPEVTEALLRDVEAELEFVKGQMAEGVRTWMDYEGRKM